MLRRPLPFVAGVGFATMVTTSQSAECKAPCPGGRCPATLATSLTRPRRPTVVFVHGLDSSKETWAGTIAELAKDQYPTLALDLRGHGESQLGDPNDYEYGCATLVADCRQAVLRSGVQLPFVLVGHSMGGRVAIAYAATHPKDLSAVVIEDIDIVPKTAPEGPRPSFSRNFDSWDEARAALLKSGYAADRVDAWKGKRVTEWPMQGWWSDINPEVAWLARKHILASPDGRGEFKQIAASGPPFPVHLWIAGKEGTVTTDDGVKEMMNILPSTHLRRFPTAGHSIHGTASGEFLTRLKGVIDDAGEARARKNMA